MIKDRGNIKWSSLMLTEHREKLEKLLQRDQDIEKPELDEQQLQEMDRSLKKALEFKQLIKVKYYKNHSFKEYQGKVLKYNTISHIITIKGSEDEYNLNVYNIIDISFANILE
ncbi:MAG: YolD-like family protein [Halanaerobiales bacterium]